VLKNETEYNNTFENRKRFVLRAYAYGTDHHGNHIEQGTESIVPDSLLMGIGYEDFLHGKLTDKQRSGQSGHKE
jgi:hypothetical protein